MRYIAKQTSNGQWIVQCSVTHKVVMQATSEYQAIQTCTKLNVVRTK